MAPLKSVRRCEVTPLITVVVELLDIVEGMKNDSPAGERFLAFV